MKFRVIRPHYGDKFYARGDQREANENSVRHLVPNTLKPMKKVTEQKKAQPKSPRNKSVGNAPKTKAG